MMMHDDQTPQSTPIDDAEVLNALNNFNAARLANELIHELHIASTRVLTYPIEGTGIHTINPDAVPTIAACILDLIANTIATLIDAGSERDAVNENETLFAAITDELNGWTATS